MTRIVTEQAPSAKPVAISLRLTTDWQTMIDVPDYDVPVVGFGSTRRIAPGVAEVSSPLLVSNFVTDAASVSVRIIRGTRPLISSPQQTEADFDIFIGGTGHAVSDVITLDNSATVLVDAVDGIGGVTEFTITDVGEEITSETTLVQAITTGNGVNFSIIVEEDNLSLTIGVFSFVTNTPVEARDTLILPLNGQFLRTKDRLQVQATVNDRLDATISYTEGQAEEDDLLGGNV